MRRVVITCFIALAVTSRLLPAEDGVPSGFKSAAIRFGAEFGRLQGSVANCYHANDRYVACFHLWENGELAQVSVVPEARISGGSFDRDHSLSKGEYLELLARISRVRSLGAFVSEDRTLVKAITNGGYTSDEEWEEAIVTRFLNAGGEGVRSFGVLYFAEVVGEVAWYPPADCRPVGDLGLPFGCREPELGPTFLSIDGRDFHLAPSDQKAYLAGQHVRVMAVDPEQRNHELSEVTIQKTKTVSKVDAP